MERNHLDTVLGAIRKKVVKGSKRTRHSRLRGALRFVPLKVASEPRDPKEFGKATIAPMGESVDGPRHEEESPMSLHDTIRQFRSVSESNTPAPGPKGKVASGAQTASKSGFDVGNPKNQKDYKGDAASIPSDAEAKAAATRSTAGVKGPGYDASGREKIDVRSEQVAVALVKDDPNLGTVIGMCYEMAETPGEFTSLVEKYVGFEKLKNKIAKKGGASDPGAIAATIGMKKYGKKKFEKAAHAGKSMKGTKPAHEEVVDNFPASTPSKDDEDRSFAQAMLADRVGDWGKRKAAEESAIPAPAPGGKNVAGPQTASKSNFDDRVKPDKDYKGDAVSIPADAEAKAAATRATAGVHGPGYDASGRERVDVRTEQRNEKPPLNEDADQRFVRENGLA